MIDEENLERINRRIDRMVKEGKIAPKKPRPLPEPLSDKVG
jgi:ribosomal protein S10